MTGTIEEEIVTLKERIRTLEEERAALLRHNEFLEKQRGIDPLTGMFNRRVFTERLASALKHLGPEEHRNHSNGIHELALIMIDIDHFKRINDTFGHAAGDEVLRRVAELLMDSVRDGDTVARLGGEEIGIIMPGASLGAAASHAEDVRTKIERLTFVGYPEISITASFGVISSQFSSDAHELYRLADKDLYAAKESGRNKVVIHGV